MLPLYETSAKDDFRQDNVEAIFMTLAFKLKASKPFYVPSELHKARVEAINHENLNNQTDTNKKASSSCSCSFY